MTGKVLVAGVGNIFLGDDGFGVEVARRLADAGLPGWVTVADYGTSGMHLAYDLASYDTAVLVDAAPRGGRPGTVTLLEVTPADGADPAARAAEPGSRLLDAHGMQPDLVLGVLEMLGAQAPTRMFVVGCEPASVDYQMGLSAPVAAAVEEAVRIVMDLAAGITAGGEHEGVSHVPRHSR